MSRAHRTLVLRAYGRTVGVAGPAAALDIIRERLPPSYRASDDSPQRRWRISVIAGLWRCDNDDGQLALVDNAVTASEIVLSDLELWVAEHARRHVFVHAGCVVVDGRAILMPGRSMSGKTSLTAALIRAGASYWSDEYAVLDSRGSVRPYPRRLAIRPYDGGRPHRVTAAAGRPRGGAALRRSRGLGRAPGHPRPGCAPTTRQHHPGAQPAAGGPRGARPGHRACPLPHRYPR
jgi:hypothetical protein